MYPSIPYICWSFDRHTTFYVSSHQTSCHMSYQLISIGPMKLRHEISCAFCCNRADSSHIYYRGKEDSHSCTGRPVKAKDLRSKRKEIGGAAKLASGRPEKPDEYWRCMGYNLGSIAGLQIFIFCTFINGNDNRSSVSQPDLPISPLLTVLRSIPFEAVE